MLCQYTDTYCQFQHDLYPLRLEAAHDYAGILRKGLSPVSANLAEPAKLHVEVSCSGNICTCASVCLSVCLSVCPSVRPSVCKSIAFRIGWTGFRLMRKHTHTFIRNRNDPYLPLPSQPQPVLIYRPRRDRRLSRLWCEVAQAEIRTRNLLIALYHTATSAP